MFKLQNGMINRVKKHFTNRGGEGEFTKYYENLNQEMQKDIEVIAEINNRCETPIIASYRKDMYLLLITDIKLYWMKKDMVFESIYLDELSYVSVDINMQNKFKNQFCGLRLMTKANSSFSVEVEPGKPLFGLQNIILLISSLSKRED